MGSNGALQKTAKYSHMEAGAEIFAFLFSKVKFVESQLYCNV